MKVGGTGIFRLEQLPGGRARQLIQTNKAVLAKLKRGPNRIKPRKKKKK